MQRTSAVASGTRRDKSHRRRDIQGLRAVAVVLVVLFHSGDLVHGGFVGVDVFFVISGFVVTGMLLRELRATGTVRLRSFYAGRARRLMPALATMLVVTAALSALLLSPVSGSQLRTANTGIAASVYASNILLMPLEGYFVSHANALLHTWTLGVEEQFYVLFPLLTLWAWRRGRLRSPTAAVAGVLLATAVGSFLLSLWLTDAHPNVAFYGSPTRAWEFAVGALLALAAPRIAGARLSRAPATAAAVVGAGLVAFGALRITPATPFPGRAALLPVAGAALVLAAGTAWPTIVSRALSVRPAVWVGDLSYSWYLWHWPPVVFARSLWPGARWPLLVAGLASLAPAWLSYRLIETPIRYDPAIVGRRVVRMATVCILVPVLACTALRVSAKETRGHGVVADVARQYRLHDDFTHGCHRVDADEACTWHPAGPSRGSVVLIGDSNAGQFTEPLARAANGLGLDFVAATHAGCPPVDVEFRLVGRSSAVCKPYLTDVLGALERQPPTVVVVSAASPTYIEGGVELREPSTGAFVADPAGKATLWSAGLRSVVSRLHQAGTSVVVVHPIPYIVGWALGECPALYIYTDVHRCGLSRSRAVTEGFRARSLRAERSAIEGIEGVRTLDLAPDLCSPTWCSTNVGRQFVYWDVNHLTVDGALRLTDRFTDVLREVAV